MRFCLLFMGALSLGAQSSRFGAAIPVHPEFLGNPQAVIQDGASRNPHWASDGRRLLFISKPEEGCPQAYWFDFETKEKRLASTGKGTVRQAVPMGKGKSWIFDSTHETGGACAPQALGSVPAAFNIFVSSEKNRLDRLVSASGYDGEAEYSNGEKRIVYTSQASGDLEIWSMEPDGMNKKQLTRSPGYDGDPHVSWDGRRIVFRSSRARSAAAERQVKLDLEQERASVSFSEIYVMTFAGRDEKQVTSFGCSVLTPVWAPDNRRIVFSSTLPTCTGDHFELFMVNLDGTGLAQLTTGNKFAGDPSFSPDGKRLAYSRDGAIVIADWLAPAPPPDTLNPLSKP
jgi:Tol biopolymer transport system component